MVRNRQKWRDLPHETNCDGLQYAARAMRRSYSVIFHLRHRIQQTVFGFF